MLRAAILAIAVCAAPAIANPYYHAQPETAPREARFVARDNAWRCSAAGCTSTRTASRPAIVCQTLVRAIGRLRSFAVEGRAFDGEALESCNARAR